MYLYCSMAYAFQGTLSEPTIRSEPGSAIWYYGKDGRWAGKWWWKDRYNRSDDGVSLQEEKPEPGSLYHWYRKLLALWHARPEIRDGSQRILCDDDAAVLCILRRQGDARTLLLVNLGKTAAAPRLDPKLVAEAGWTDLLDSGAPGQVDAVLQPLQVRII